MFWVAVSLGLLRLFFQTPSGVYPLFQWSVIATQSLFLGGVSACGGGAIGTLAGRNWKGLYLGAALGLPIALLWCAFWYLGYVTRDC